MSYEPPFSLNLIFLFFIIFLIEGTTTHARIEYLAQVVALALSVIHLLPFMSQKRLEAFFRPSAK